MAEFKVRHKLEDVAEGTEMVLADSSVLHDEDMLVSFEIKDCEKGVRNQEIRKKLNGTFLHSYEHKTGLLEKYDEAKQDEFILKEQELAKIGFSPEKPKEKVAKVHFAVPKKRLRIVDLAEGENASENQLNSKPHKSKKNPIFEEESDERLELEFKINTMRPIIKTTPLTQEGEDFDIDQHAPINPTRSQLDPKLSLKDAGSTSVFFVPLPTERIQTETEEKPVNDWEHKDRPLGRGLSSCLDLLRSRKLLGSVKEVGRKKDKTENSDSQYFDSKGRLITKKQAFRMQCYSFHNQKPNQNKLKKIENEIQAEIKSNQTDQSLGTSSFRHVKSIMHKTQSPYVGFIDLLLPEARINVPGALNPDKKLVKTPELPVKRHLKPSSQPKKKQKMFDISDTDQESAKIPQPQPSKSKTALKPIPELPENHKSSTPFQKASKKTQTVSKQYFSLPQGLYFELPSTRRKQKTLEILPTDPQEVQFSKIFQKLFPTCVYSSSEHLLKAPQKPNRIEIEEKSIHDSVSNVTDSFITPEDSPLLQNSPISSKISRFELESPLTHIPSITSFDWGKPKESQLISTPFFPPVSNFQSDFKSNILFPEKNEKVEKDEIFEEAFQECKKIESNKSDSKVEGMEILLSKENSNNIESMEVVEKSPQIGENSGFSVLRTESATERFNTQPIESAVERFNTQSIENSPERFNTQSIFTNVTVPTIQPFSSALGAQNVNPFLDVSQAAVAKPIYVFGSGDNRPAAFQMPAGSNPFLVNNSNIH